MYGEEAAQPPEEITSFLVGLTSQGWRAFTLEGERIPGCVGTSFDAVTDMVRERHPAALLFAISLPVDWSKGR